MNSRKTKIFGRIGSLAACAYAALCGVSCELTHGDPVHEAQVEALGPEQPGISEGPFHRAGQPCNVCHGKQGPAKAQFSLAGTVFAAPSGSASQAAMGVENAAVGIIDSVGAPFLASTNCVGNFYVAPDRYNPTFPILVAVSKGKTAVLMTSHITRETSCASCHTREVSDTSPGQVYLSTPDMPMDCPSGINPSTPISRGP
jgi:hypothetical protein